MIPIPMITIEGANLAQVNFGVKLHLWFSYQVLVAFHVCGYSWVVHQNDWSRTTGKHLNRIDGGARSERVDDDTFYRLWRDQTDCLFDDPLPEALLRMPAGPLADWLEDNDHPDTAKRVHRLYNL